jgi:hypothetical protein
VLCVSPFGLGFLDDAPLTQEWGADSPVVLLPNYRFSYLRPEDHDFFRQHYVALRRDFYVLGVIIPKRARVSWRCLRGGTYRLSVGLHDAGRLSVNGVPNAHSRRSLEPGIYDFVNSGDSDAFVIWAPPTVEDRDPSTSVGAEDLMPIPGAF